MTNTMHNWLHSKSAQALASAFLLGLSLMIGANILPLTDKYKVTIAYSIRGSTGIAPGVGPLFSLDKDLFPHQCGKGTLKADGILVLTAYSATDCSYSVGNLRPHLLPVDIRIPWALVPDETREELHRLSVASLEHAQTVALRLFRSPFFTQDYVPKIHEILGSSLRQIWSAPSINQTLLHATESLDQDRANELLQGLMPIVSEHARSNFWRTLRLSMSTLMGSSSRAQQEAVAQLMSEIISDPRLGERLSVTLPPLLASSGTVSIGASVIRETINALLTDPRLQDLALQLFTDRRFLRLRPIGSDAEQLFMTLPYSLLRMRHRLDHNPLVSYVLRELLRGRSSFIVVMLSPEQEQKMSTRNLPPEPTLTRLQ
ncbi:hypothetical protein TI04_04090 [Achromatium sp. WMS2]|nr:hypothetical protein TI04_04090 [Achromatium sp. WMS2]